MKRKLAWLVALCLCMEGILNVEAYASVSGNTIGATLEATQISENNIEDENQSNEQEYVLSYQDIDKEAPEIVDLSNQKGISRERIFDIPSKYRSDQVDTDGDGTPDANFIPSRMRSQGNYGTCWAFSALASCEASLIRKGLATQDIDLSESQLVYYFYNKSELLGDLMGNTIGDYNRNISATDYRQLGGNSYFTMWQLASWAGPSLEARHPYSKIGSADTDFYNTTADIYGNDAYHLQNCYIVNRTDQESMKQLIMQNGSLGLSYYGTQTSSAACAKYDSMKAGKYTGDEGSYYCYDQTSTNHAVQVIGWDDNYSASNFVATPPGNGAWLMKNSWGNESSTLAQNGYFWISYYDTSLADIAFAYDCEGADNYDKIYQYDGSSYPYSYYVRKAANVFIANGREQLEAVSIGTDTPGAEYQIDIYTYPEATVVNESKIEAGTKVLTQTGRFTYAGYQTIALNRSVQLTQGMKFSVVFTFPEGAEINRDCTGKNGSWLKFFTAQTTGQSFYQTLSGSIQDAANYNATMRIKAFTNNVSVKPVESVSLNSTELTMRKEQIVELTASEYPADISNRISWSSSDTNVATVSGGRVMAIGAGRAVITARCGGKQASCTVNVISPLQRIILSPQVMEVECGSSQSLQVGFYPYDTTEDRSVSYQSSDVSVATVHDGVVTAKKIGSAVITATGANGKTATATVRVVKKIKELILSSSECTLNYGQTHPISVTILPEDTTDNRNITFTSDHPEIAYVQNQIIYAVGYGEANITATAANGVNASCKVKVKTTNFEKPVLTAGVSKTSSQAKISWAKAGDCDGYVVYRSNKKSGGYELVKKVAGNNKTSFIDKALSCGKKYYYKIQCYKKKGGKLVYSDYSKPIAIKIVPKKAALGKCVSQKGAITIKVKKVAKADGYQIYRSTNPNSKGKKLATLEDSNAFVDKKIKKNVTYYYRVRAYQLVGKKKVYGPFSEVKVVNGK